LLNHYINDYNNDFKLILHFSLFIIYLKNIENYDLNDSKFEHNIYVLFSERLSSSKSYDHTELIMEAFFGNEDKFKLRTRFPNLFAITPAGPSPKDLESPEAAFQYLRGHNLNDQAVRTIAMNAKVSLDYARYLNHTWQESPSKPIRFKEGEEVISLNPEIALNYAVDILQGRFESAEETISKNPLIAYLYAKKILHKRFELAESSICTDDKVWGNYSFEFLRTLKLPGLRIDLIPRKTPKTGTIVYYCSGCWNHSPQKEHLKHAKECPYLK
jgi:hypothetical protein